jgi:leucyl aminopeptidase
MTNPNNKSQILKNDNIKTLIAEGQNIAKFLKDRDNKEFSRAKGMLTVDTLPSEMFDFDLTLAKQEKKLGNDYKVKPIGVWFRLGFLAHQISKGVTDKNSIGLRMVDRRRISEAKIFWENHTECLEILKASKKGYNSLSALIKKFNDNKKAITEEASTEDTSSSEAKQSDVGQTTEGNKATPTLPKSAKEVLELLKVTCDRSNIPLSEVLELLLEEEANKLKETSKGSFQVIGKTVIHDNKLAVNDCPF